MEQETFNRMVTEFEELNKAMEAYQGILSIRIGLNNQEGWLDKSTPEISNNKSDNETTAEDISNTKDTKITENTNEVSE